MNSTSINPFLARRRKPVLRGPLKQARFALLPRAPVNTSPVPRLTSLYHHADVGAYGKRSYPGNCGGNLIRDLLLYFKPRVVLDPMTGSGTCADVCRELPQR